MKNSKCFFLFVFFLVHSTSTVQATFFLSTQNSATLAGTSFQQDDIVEYDQDSMDAQVIFNGDNFSANENIDALHIFGSGSVAMVISTTTNATLGGITFEDGDLVLHDPFSGSASLYFTEDDHFDLTEDIDALSILDNGNLVLSTDNAAILGGLSFGEGDLVEYNPVTQAAQLIFDESLFSQAENIDAVHVNEDGTIIISTATAATLAGLTFDEDDLILYDPLLGTATSLLDGNAHFSQQENIDAVSASVPVPGALWLVITGLGLAGLKRRLQQK